MAAIELDDADRQILRDCPITIVTKTKPSKVEAAKMVRIKRLWTHGLVGGDVGADGKTLTVRIRNPGRAEIGRVALPEGV